MSLRADQLMPSKHDREQQQAEFDFILASRVFPPHSNPSRFLEFVCAKYFEGRETVSEYDIAVEALGRRADFNPKQDAIVRVEAHRVRKRLCEFYQKEGAGRECRLVIPMGAYLPVFTGRTAETPVSPGPEPAFAGLALHLAPQHLRKIQLRR